MVRIYGDVNNDGKVDIVDAMFISQYTVGNRTLSPEDILVGDVNGDGVCDVVDAMMIAQYTTDGITRGKIGQNFTVNMGSLSERIYPPETFPGTTFELIKTVTNEENTPIQTIIINEPTMTETTNTPESVYTEKGELATVPQESLVKKYLFYTLAIIIIVYLLTRR